MKKTASTIIAAFACLTAHAAFAFDFKGVEPGTRVTPTELHGKLSLRGFDCLPDANGSGDNVCHGKVNIGDAEATAWCFIGKDGTLNAITVLFAPDDFAPIAKALTEKFGKPAKTDNSKVQNRMGAKFDQIEIAWTNAAQEATLSRYYGGKLDRSGFDIVTKAHLAALARKSAVKKGDL